MDLLPRSHKQFQLKDYWNTFFTKRKESFEWYGEYQDLCHVLHKYLKPQNQLLVVGCGNSKLSESLYDAGIHQITNIDISGVVIRQMASRNKDLRPKMVFSVMDMLSMEHEGGHFDAVLDKGTLDALFTDEAPDTIKKVDQMFGEIGRVLKVGGRFVCISLCQEHILGKLMSAFSNEWLVRVHKIDQIPEGGGGGGGVGGVLPVFVFVMTKMATIPGREPIQVFEYANSEGQCVRCSGSEELAEFVKSSQQFTLITHHMRSLHYDEQPQLDLWGATDNTEPRYTLRVVDLPRRKAKKGQFAIFIVPQGRETEWMFSSESGSRQLAESAGFERLVVVTLHRGHHYRGVETVKEEVSVKAMELAQDGLPDGRKWPVLTLGEGLGCRRVLLEDSSPLSGGFVVEESEVTEGGGGGEWVRRLVFVDTSHLAQTEVKMRPVQCNRPRKGRRSKRSNSSSVESGLVTMEPDHTHLMFGYHQSIISSLVMIEKLMQNPTGGVATLLIGLGGGALPMFLHKCFPQVSVTVIEQDPKMVEVATKWFGFVQSGKGKEAMAVRVSDGVEFVEQSASRQDKVLYHALLLDVDSKDSSSGMSSPPLSFLTDHFLASVQTLLHPGGILVTNLSARNKELRSSALSSLLNAFPYLLVLQVPDDINEVVVCLPEWREELFGDAPGKSSEKQEEEKGFSEVIMSELSSAIRERIELMCAHMTGSPSSLSQGLIQCYNNCICVYNK